MEDLLVGDTQVGRSECTGCRTRTRQLPAAVGPSLREHRLERAARVEMLVLPAVTSWLIT